MSVYNDAAYLDRAVRSILDQTFADFEFLIVNDGSTDGSTEILRAFAAGDARIRLIEQENRGLIASLNRALGEARTPWIARMDGDDVSLPQRFERQFAFLQANPDYGVIGCQRLRIDQHDRPIPGGTGYPVTHEDFTAAMREGRQLLCHPGAMLSREMIDAAGGYRRAFRHCEDYDLWLRLSERTRIRSLDEVLLHYRVTRGQISTAHLLEMCTGVRIAWQAHLERTAGRPDPIDGIERLPAIDALDQAFGQAGLGRAVRAQVAGDIVYSVPALTGGGVPLLLAHVAEGGARGPLWRCVARLLRHGEFGWAMQLAAGLLRPAGRP